MRTQPPILRVKSALVSRGIFRFVLTEMLSDAKKTSLQVAESSETTITGVTIAKLVEAYKQTYGKKCTYQFIHVSLLELTKLGIVVKVKDSRLYRINPKLFQTVDALIEACVLLDTSI